MELCSQEISFYLNSELSCDVIPFVWRPLELQHMQLLQIVLKKC